MIPGGEGGDGGKGSGWKDDYREGAAKLRITQEESIEREAIEFEPAGDTEADQTEQMAKSDGYTPRCYSLQELADNPPPPVEWRVDGWIQAKGITGLISRPKVGKSYALQQAGLCIASGAVDFLGCKTKPGRVLYIDEEMGKQLVFARWLRMRAAYQEIGSPFNATGTLSRYHFVSLGGLCIDKPDQIRAEIEKAKPNALIVDSFRRIYRGKENDSDQIARAMAFFAEIRSEYDLDVIISHHTRKNLEGSEFWEDAARGSSDFFAACDGLLGLGKRGKGLAELRASLRAAAEPDPINLVFDDQIGIWKVSSQLAPSAAAFDGLAAVKEILLTKPGFRWPQKLVAQVLQTQYNRTDKQSEKILSKLPALKTENERPLDIHLFKLPIPGSTNANEVVLAVSQ